MNLTIKFGIDEVKIALSEKGIESGIGWDKKAFIKFFVQPENTQLKAEGFTIKKENDTILVIAFDIAGACRTNKTVWIGRC
ncbi:hypothetical protein [Formosa sp. PL04]|uniref:hypothetical protein n=1 Tax=Formosa sp. PL04 TaxID=3081755 RepID=UPI00298202F2|nr:hypothetical protein [Formosa sp. PL04]MDW5289182.1 hypothetical protein [Formosa sp. PL04]